MKHLYYTRHGESNINVSGIWEDKLGHARDRGLTELGRQQAQAAGKQAALDGVRVDTILISPLPRAQETAQILAGFLNCKNLETLDLLIERDFGTLEGTELAEFFANHTYKDIDSIEDAETIENLQARARKALKLIESRAEEKILVVSHAAFGRAFLREVAGLPYTAEYIGERVEIPHAKIIQLLP